MAALTSFFLSLCGIDACMDESLRPFQQYFSHTRMTIRYDEILWAMKMNLKVFLSEQKLHSKIEAWAILRREIYPV